MVLNYIIRYAYKTITGGFSKEILAFYVCLPFVESVCIRCRMVSDMAHNLKIVDIYNQVSL